jgi:cbb3-type cytochrome oxidase subunit 3
MILSVTHKLRRLIAITAWAAGLLLATAAPALADDRPDGAEMATASSMMVVIAVFFILSVLGIWFAWSNGEFHEPEEVKYHMLAMIDNEPDYWGIGSHDDDDDEGGSILDVSPQTPSSPARELVAANR